MSLGFLAPLVNLILFSIWFGFFDDVYGDAVFTSRQESHPGWIWTCIVLFFMTACIWRCYEAWSLVGEKKITLLDMYFTCALNLMALVHFSAHFIALRNLRHKDNMLRMACLGEWSLLPFLGWTVVWSRHVRRGW